MFPILSPLETKKNLAHNFLDLNTKRVFLKMWKCKKYPRYLTPINEWINKFSYMWHIYPRQVIILDITV